VSTRRTCRTGGPEAPPPRRALLREAFFRCRVCFERDGGRGLCVYTRHLWRLTRRLAMAGLCVPVCERSGGRQEAIHARVRRGR
jgi:hypothetical protein